jgi:hypothetical protein
MKSIRGSMLKYSSRKDLLQAGLVLILCLLLLPFAGGWIPLVEFTDEEIAIQVYPDHLQMIGTYHYANPFPFPIT